MVYNITYIINTAPLFDASSLVPFLDGLTRWNCKRLIRNVTNFRFRQSEGYYCISEICLYFVILYILIYVKKRNGLLFVVWRALLSYRCIWKVI